jgi:hypothetical protein
MNTTISMLNKFVAALFIALSLVACGGGSGGGGGVASSTGDTATASSGLTLRLTDAKVNSLEEVWITFTKVIFQPADGRDRFEHVFDPPITVELTQLAGGGEVMLLEEYPLEPGDYEWMRLAVLSGEDYKDKTYVVEDDGGEFFLKCPSCSADQSGLKLKWPKEDTWETEGWVDFTVDFDVRRSITLAKPNAGPGKKYILKPVLQILTTELASTFIHGKVISVEMADPARREDCVVYVFEGKSDAVTPDDYCSLDFEGAVCDENRDDIALTTAPVDFDGETGEYTYWTKFLYPGFYTVALTCEDDSANIEQNPTFFGKTGLFADAVANGAEHDFSLADVELTLTKELTVDNSPYEEGEKIDYSYTVTNDSARGADGIVGPVVIDDDKAEVDCKGVDSVGNGDDNLDPGEEIICTSSYTVTRADVLAESVTNTATASMGSGAISNTDDLTIDTTTTPVLEVAMSGMLDGPFEAGQTISYRFEAANKGNVALTIVEISDALLSLGPLSCTPTQPVAELAIDDAFSCETSYPITADDVSAGSVSNRASATSTEITDPVETDPVVLPGS